MLHSSLKSMTISYICKGSKGRLSTFRASQQEIVWFLLRRHQQFMKLSSRWIKLTNIIVKTDSLLTILSIMSKIIVSKQSSNMTEDIRFLTKNIRNVRLSFIIGQLILQLIEQRERPMLFLVMKCKTFQLNIVFLSSKNNNKVFHPKLQNINQLWNVPFIIHNLHTKVYEKGFSCIELHRFRNQEIRLLYFQTRFSDQKRKN